MSDIDILEEALDLETASRQMDLAEMGYNEATEQEANRQREMHELKPASWWATTFNTDGELRRREEGVKIQMALTSAKQSKDVFSLWRSALEPSSDKFKKGPYLKIISQLKKFYPDVGKKSGTAIRQQAVSGELDERNALITAYTKQQAFTNFKQAQQGACAGAQALRDVAKQESMLEKPSLFHQMFNTKQFQSYSKQSNDLKETKSKLEQKYQEHCKKKTAHQSEAFEYVVHWKSKQEQLKKKYPELAQTLEKPKSSEPSLLNVVSPLGALTQATSPSSKKTTPRTPQERWGIKTSAPSQTSEMDSFQQPPQPKRLYD